MMVGDVVFMDDKTRHLTLLLSNSGNQRGPGGPGPGNHDCKMDERTCNEAIITAFIFPSPRERMWGCDLKNWSSRSSSNLKFPAPLVYPF